MNLRSAVPADAAAITSVHLAALGEAMPGLRQVHTPAQVEAWYERVVLPRSSTMVAEEPAIVGYVVVDGRELEQLYVEPSAQGRGIGTGLLASAVGQGARSLWTFQANARARAFYERRGWAAVELTDGSRNEEGEPDVRYELRRG